MPSLVLSSVVNYGCQMSLKPWTSTQCPRLCLLLTRQSSLQVVRPHGGNAITLCPTWPHVKAWQWWATLPGLAQGGCTDFPCQVEVKKRPGDLNLNDTGKFCRKLLSGPITHRGDIVSHLVLDPLGQTRNCEWRYFRDVQTLKCPWLHEIKVRWMEG